MAGYASQAEVKVEDDVDSGETSANPDMDEYVRRLIRINDQLKNRIQERDAENSRLRKDNAEKAEKIADLQSKLDRAEFDEASAPFWRQRFQQLEKQKRSSDEEAAQWMRNYVETKRIADESARRNHELMKKNETLEKELKYAQEEHRRTAKELAEIRKAKDAASENAGRLVMQLREAISSSQATAAQKAIEALNVKTAAARIEEELRALLAEKEDNVHQWELWAGAVNANFMQLQQMTPKRVVGACAPEIPHPKQNPMDVGGSNGEVDHKDPFAFESDAEDVVDHEWSQRKQPAKRRRYKSTSQRKERLIEKIVDYCARINIIITAEEFANMTDEERHQLPDRQPLGGITKGARASAARKALSKAILKYAANFADHEMEPEPRAFQEEPNLMPVLHRTEPLPAYVMSGVISNTKTFLAKKQFTREKLERHLVQCLSAFGVEVDINTLRSQAMKQHLLTKTNIDEIIDVSGRMESTSCAGEMKRILTELFEAIHPYWTFN